MGKQDILLETGTNEVEIAEFIINSQSFGVNVAKIREFVPYDQLDVTKIPERHPSMLGIFLLRNNTIPLIDLKTYLDTSGNGDVTQQVVAVTDFNNTINGFIIDSVKRIHRLSWKDIKPLDGLIENCSSAIIGSIHIEEREVLLLDLESIVDGIFPEYSMAAVGQDCMEKPIKDRRQDKRLIVAEDSNTIRTLITNILASVGYTNVKAFENGKDAYDEIVKLKACAEEEGKNITDYVSLAVLDIEMPQMDGLTLCKNIKYELELSEVTVIMFSSLINKQMETKCKKVGADAHITKPEIQKLVELADKFCFDESGLEHAAVTN